MTLSPALRRAAIETYRAAAARDLDLAEEWEARPHRPGSAASEVAPRARHRAAELTALADRLEAE